MDYVIPSTDRQPSRYTAPGCSVVGHDPHDLPGRHVAAIDLVRDYPRRHAANVCRRIVYLPTTESQFVPATYICASKSTVWASGVMIINCGGSVSRVTSISALVPVPASLLAETLRVLRPDAWAMTSFCISFSYTPRAKITPISC